MNCKLCGDGLTEPASLAAHACKDCRETHGISPMPPTRRPPHPCLRCQTTRFVRAVPRDPKGGTGETGHVMTVPFAHSGSSRVLGALLNPHAEPLEAVPFLGRGKLETFVCLGCGHVETYCLDPQNIPLGPELMTEVVDAAAATPYR